MVGHILPDMLWGHAELSGDKPRRVYCMHRTHIAGTVPKLVLTKRIEAQNIEDAWEQASMARFYGFISIF